MKDALRFAGHLAMAMCTVLVVAACLVYVVGQAIGIPVRVTYQTVARADVPARQRVVPTLPGVAPTPVDSMRAASDTAAAARAPAVQNVILFIGDGMGLSMLSTVDALADERLFVSGFPVTGLVRMASLNDLITDSAAGATAFSTGYRTSNGAVAMTLGGEGEADFVPRRTILEAAAAQGFATGVVTTSYLADATPAAFVAHAPDRDLYGRIASQMVGSQADVLVGGAQPKVFTDSLRRAARGRGFTVASSLEGLADAPANARWLGLFPERDGLFDKMHGPPLAETTEAVLRKLRQGKERFFLVVEQEGTDAAGHVNRLGDAQQYLRELDRAVERALQIAGEETLVLVTADHDTGGLSIVDARRDESEGGGERGPSWRRSGEVTARWNVFGHTADWTPLLAYGPGAQRFTGVLENTSVPRRLASLLGLADFPEGEATTGDALTARPPLPKSSSAQGR